MNIRYDCKSHLPPAYFKSSVLSGWLSPLNLFIPDESAQPRVPNALTEALQLFPASLSHQFNPPIRQIANHAGHFISGGRLAGCDPEPHPLHPAGIPDCHPTPFHNAAGTIDETPGSAKPGFRKAG
jgi:hypothetical protein